MKFVNIWKSTPSGMVYEMPTDWLPRFGGWELLGTEERPEEREGE